MFSFTAPTRWSHQPSRLLLLLTTLAALSRHVLPSAAAPNSAGPRDNGCSFGFNNTFYILGGLILDTTYNNYLFASTPLPIDANAPSQAWTALARPPSWEPLPKADGSPQTHCSLNKDGKVFLFGNMVGYAVFDLIAPDKGWSTPSLSFASSYTIANLQNQVGISSAVHPDGYTISILASSPPTYFILDTKTGQIRGSPTNMPSLHHGFCMAYVPSLSNVVQCGGSSNRTYNPNCNGLSQAAASSTFKVATMTSPMDGCTMVATESGFALFPGYLESYLTVPPPTNAPAPGVSIFNADKTWTTISNNQNIIVPTLSYAFAAVMPGTNKVIYYGGSSPDGTFHNSKIYIFNLANNQWESRVDPVESEYVRTSSVPGSGPANPAGTAQGGSSKVGAIAGGVGGAVVLIGAIGGVLFMRKRKGGQYKRPPTSSASLAGEFSHGHHGGDGEASYPMIVRKESHLTEGYMPATSSAQSGAYYPPPPVQRYSEDYHSDGPYTQKVPYMGSPPSRAPHAITNDFALSPESASRNPQAIVTPGTF